MLNNLNHKRYGLALVQMLLVVAVVAASVVSLAHPNCRDRTLDLTLDGVYVGALVAGVRLLHILRRRPPQPVSGWWCLARVLYGIELKYGLVGGYLLGITRAAVECLGR